MDTPRDPSTEIVLDLLHRRHDLTPELALDVLAGAARRKGVEIGDIAAAILHHGGRPAV